MGDLHGYRRAVDQHDLVRPVELAGLARRKTQRYIGFRRSRARHTNLRVTPNRIVAAFITEAAQLLEDPDQCRPLASRASPRYPTASGQDRRATTPA